MSGENDRPTAYHLREALWHLEEARDGLRKTNAAAVREVADTVETVLRDHEREE